MVWIEELVTVVDHFLWRQAGGFQTQRPFIKVGAEFDQRNVIVVNGRPVCRMHDYFVDIENPLAIICQ